MKHLNVILLIFFVLSSGCKQRSEPRFYKNLFTGGILTQSEFDRFEKDLIQKYHHPEKQSDLNIRFYKLLFSKDSVIQPFKYSIRVGGKYIMRADSFPKIGMRISPKKFITLGGDSVQIGGEQSKPAVINLWFVGCRGCIQEMPALNEIQKKYSSRVDFLAMTFDTNEDVYEFLKRKKFNFRHIVGAESFIKYIGTKPYPETIFVDRHGVIRNIEGIFSDNDLVYIESIIDKLLISNKPVTTN